MAALLQNDILNLVQGLTIFVVSGFHITVCLSTFVHFPIPIMKVSHDIYTHSAMYVALFVDAAW